MCVCDELLCSDRSVWQLLSVPNHTPESHCNAALLSRKDYMARMFVCVCLYVCVYMCELASVPKTVCVCLLVCVVCLVYI